MGKIFHLIAAVSMRAQSILRPAAFDLRPEATTRPIGSLFAMRSNMLKVSSVFGKKFGFANRTSSFLIKWFRSKAGG